jgi:hypothetical protein
MRTPFFVLQHVFLLLGMSACDGSSTPVDPSPGTVGGVIASIDFPTSATVGERVNVQLVLTNASVDSVELHLAGVPGRPYFGVLISNARGDSVVRIWNTAVGNRALSKIWLLRGTSITMSATLDLPSADTGLVPAGSYFVTGSVLGEPERRTNKSAFVVVNP